MEIAPIVARLEAQLTGFKKIGGAADLEAIGNGVVTTPSCYVIPTRETASDIDLVGGFEQAITVGFSVVIAVSNLRDATGGAAIDVLDALRKQIKSALHRWVPDPTNGEAVRFDSGALVRFDDGLLWWLDEYRVLTYERIL